MILHLFGQLSGQLGAQRRRPASLDACDALGATAVALPAVDGCAAPPGCQLVVADAAGRTRRVEAAAGKRVALADGERAWVFHPGPYTVDLLPFALAPEIGLRTSFAIDAAATACERRRFDLYLAAEVAGRLDAAQLGAAIEDALRRELAQGGLDLPPCTTVEEWNAFRQGLNQLLYLRFGVTVDDCVPVDLGAQAEGACDYAAQLAARAAQQEAPAPVEGGRREPVLGAPVDGCTAAAVMAGASAEDDARAVRRLFLELPCLMRGLRLAALPGDADLFRRQQGLLQRLDLLAVGAATMPALDLAAPGRPVPPAERERRAAHAVRAAAALDEAWALLARLEGAAQDSLAGLYDELDRIVANLELDCGARRAVEAS